MRRGRRRARAARPRSRRSRSTDVTPSPALSQLGGTWPIDGRTVGIVVDAGSDAEAVEGLTDELREAGLTPLLVAATGGPIWPDRDQGAHRTLLTTRSVEFDAVVVAALLPPTASAPPGPAGAGAVDPRLSLLVDEAFRHGKGIGVLGSTNTAAAVGLSDDAAGVVIGDGAAVAAGVIDGLAHHRAWDRFSPAG